MQEQIQFTLTTVDWQVVQAELVVLALRGEWFEAEKLIRQRVQEAMDGSLANVLNEVLADDLFRKNLRIVGGMLGLRCRGDHLISVIFPGGTRYQVKSPYFVKAQPQGKRRHKRGPGQQRGRHLALELLGFIKQTSPTLAFRALALSALCPSFATASQVLANEDINLSADKLRQLAASFDDLTHAQRAELSSGDGESLAGKRVLIAVDGGRCRERRAKKGRVPDDLKRRGYDTDWREPKLFTIAVLNADGELDRTFPLQADATLEGLDGLLALLRTYLHHLHIDRAQEVILVGDGAKWLWNHLPGLLNELGVPTERIVEVLDHTHAKQQLHELLDQLRHCTWKHQEETRRQELLDLLWNGQIDQLVERLADEAAKGHKRAVAKKANDYFRHNAHRMQYASFKAKAIPRGSGIVESAIRRIINLRVKSTGSFWLLRKAETMLFLRAKLLYGRWHHVVNAWTNGLKAAFAAIPTNLAKTPMLPSLNRAAA